MEDQDVIGPPLIGRDHPGINFSRLEIEGNPGGLVAVVGIVVALLIGLPVARMFFFAALAGGLLVAVALRSWQRRHDGRPTATAALGRVGADQNG